MKGLPERSVASNFTQGSSTDSTNSDPNVVSLDQKTSKTKSSKASIWSSFFPSFSIFEACPESSPCGKKEFSSRTYGWTTTLRRAVKINSMRRFQERFLGLNKTDFSSSTSEKWLLGVCYKASSEESSDGFGTIGDSKFTSDVNWGCMLRSSQMLVAQPFDPVYIEIRHLFGDSEQSAFSIHNLLQAGRFCGLAAGAWVGPYAMCRSWEALAHAEMEKTNLLEGYRSLPMAVYIVSGDEDGERGGAPVIYIERAAKLCCEFCNGEDTWAPILLLVPLVLGLGGPLTPRHGPSTIFFVPGPCWAWAARPNFHPYLGQDLHLG
ncbi:Elongation factor [Cinnamomum micranthum f. kanehirae]|uniref:Cysteine protease n=1 Tax=Cinnamomum micranthum f. kanehirae TaxID=337451 RepID=A0A3S3PUD2_9MAGN|nr:Elongation factor [Cinnamomum micranthum f. kanehirae]